MAQEQKHLSIEQIEGFLEARPADSKARPELSQEARSHLAACDSCQRLVSMHKDVDQQLLSIGHTGLAEATADCPPHQALLELAAGTISGRDAEDVIAHVTACDYCGLLLRRASAVFSDDVSDEEILLLNKSQTISSERQRKMAGQMTETSRTICEVQVPTAQLTPKPLITVQPWRRRFLRIPRLAWSVALAAILAAASWMVFRMTLAPRANQLLAIAYSENRVMELRISGAQNAPLHLERGPAGSILDQPQALLDANALIARELKSRPDDPQWLQAKGRADLLAFRYEPAMESLRRALDLEPDSPSVMIDLASAYFERAQANSNRSVDYGIAVEYLGRALARNSDNPVALFNRAIAEEKLHLYDPAGDDWKHYLRIDPAGAWAEEARRRLDELEQTIQHKRISLTKPLLTTAGLISLSGPYQEEELESRIEDYLHLALKEWLPRAFAASTGPDQAGEVQDALGALARILKTNHGDWWLSDLLSSHRSGFAHAIGALAVAVRADDDGDYAKARAQARETRSLFRSANNFPGEVIAEVEEAYADHLLYEENDCAELTRSLRQRLPGHKYEWLEARTNLEAATCAGLAGDLGRAVADINQGTIKAGDHHYPGLFLRGLGFQADTAGYLGDTQEDFLLASKGLSIFWASQIDVLKGYNFYTDLDTAADVLRLPNLQVRLWQQATSLVELHPDVVQRAMAHRWYGNSAYLAEMPELAALEFAKASSLFAVAPPTEATVRGKMDADIWLAGLELRRGDLTRAAEHLQQVRNTLDRAPSFGPEIGFYSTQAELSLRTNDPRGAESALQVAIHLAEWALRSLPSADARRQWVKQTDGAYRNLVDWELRQGKVQEALEFWEWYKGAEYRTVRNPTRSPFHSLESAVPPDLANAPPLKVPAAVSNHMRLLHAHTIVSYAVLSNAVAVWTYDDRGIFFQWIPGPPAYLKAQAIRFQHLCSTRDSSLTSLRSTGRTLFDILIKPIAGRLSPGRALVFELDDVLPAIPMEALVDSDGRYLAQGTAVVGIESLYQILHVHPATAITRETSALVVSVPKPADQEAMPLWDAEMESRTVAESFRAATWLRGDAATLTAIRRELPHAVVFHFSGHAVALPERNGLLLAQLDSRTQRAQLVAPDTFTSSSVRSLQLAVLSACATGTEDAASGTDGLGQALLRAGVPHVVASRWSVDSVETAKFMQKLYQQLAAGKSVADSVHLAQLAQASVESSRHPYYWAAFGVQGL